MEEIWTESPSDSEPGGALSEWDRVFLLYTLLSCSVLLEVSPSFPEEATGFLRLGVTLVSEVSMWAFSDGQTLTTFWGWGVGNSVALLLVDFCKTCNSEESCSSGITDVGFSSVTETLRICFLKWIFARSGFGLVAEETVWEGVSAIDVGTMGVCSVLLSVLCPPLSEVDCDEAAWGSATDFSGLAGMKNRLCSGFLVCAKLKDTFWRLWSSRLTFVLVPLCKKWLDSITLGDRLLIRAALDRPSTLTYNTRKTQICDLRFFLSMQLDIEVVSQKRLLKCSLTLCENLLRHHSPPLCGYIRTPWGHEREERQKSICTVHVELYNNLLIWGDKRNQNSQDNLVILFSQILKCKRPFKLRIRMLEKTLTYRVHFKITSTISSKPLLLFSWKSIENDRKLGDWLIRNKTDIAVMSLYVSRLLAQLGTMTVTQSNGLKWKVNDRRYSCPIKFTGQ